MGVLLLLCGACENNPAGGDVEGAGDTALADALPGDTAGDSGTGPVGDAVGDSSGRGDAPVALDMGLECTEPNGYLVVGCPEAARPRLPEVTSPTGGPCYLDMWFTYDRPAAYPPPVCAEAPVLSWCFVEAAGGIELLDTHDYDSLAAEEAAENWYPWVIVSGACQPFTVCDAAATCTEPGCPGCTRQTLYHATWLGWD